ncbi:MULTISPECIES: glycoside hydrolase family protein [Rhodovulum]|nr:MULTISPECIES: peptidoglycan-binding protein [Rhodovulum]MRH22669.1 lysozyme [Rhodovulum strictum]
MQTSEQGRAFLEGHEGVALRAYRCPAGKWTIGAGLTAASGVVVPKAGMVITRTEANRLLALALMRNYEPAVGAAMPGAKQHEFDAGVSFHFNTGAIGRATWVKRWRVKAPVSEIRAALGEWRKGGGKVLPGLVLRRAEEFEMLAYGRYAGIDRVATVPVRADGLARFAVPVSEAEIAEIRKGFASLGFDPGTNAHGVLATTAREFQRRYGLTVDGIIGRATLSALQRALDARVKVQAGVVGAGGSAGGVTAARELPEAAPAGLADALSAAPWIEPIILGLGAIWLAWLAWTYRDALAARLDRRFPRIAAKLRSI